jgi:putative transposase
MGNGGYKTTSHSKYKLKVHLVFIPKGRKRVLRGEVGNYIAVMLKRICVELDIEIISGKLSIDHVHMLISYPPQHSISKIVQKLKGKSSYKVLNHFPHLRKIFWGKHFWARGYLAVSTGTMTEAIEQKYIEDQSGKDLHQRDLEVSN